MHSQELRLKWSLAEDQYKEQRIVVEDLKKQLRVASKNLDMLDGQRKTYQGLTNEAAGMERQEAEDAKKAAEAAAIKAAEEEAVKRKEMAAAIDKAVDKIVPIESGKKK